MQPVKMSMNYWAKPPSSQRQTLRTQADEEPRATTSTLGGGRAAHDTSMNYWAEPPSRQRQLKLQAKPTCTNSCDTHTHTLFGPDASRRWLHVLPAQPPAVTLRWKPPGRCDGRQRGIQSKLTASPSASVFTIAPMCSAESSQNRE